MAKSTTKGTAVQAKSKKETGKAAVKKPAAKTAVKKETAKPTATAKDKKVVTPKSEPEKRANTKALPKKTAEKPVIAKAPKQPEPTNKSKTEKITAKKPVPPTKTPVESPVAPIFLGADDKGDISIEKKLVSLFSLQLVDTEINKIRIIRGELPLEVQDLEDEIAGLETRLENFEVEIKELETEIKEIKTAAKEHQAQIKKYETQQMNVRNNREYDALTKEIEFQTLEIQLCEKKTKEITYSLELKSKVIEETRLVLKERKDDLKQKKLELDDIVSETEKEEKKLLEKHQENQQTIEERLLTAYQRIKKNARNGLAVVVVERDACGGCFNKIPPQRQLDIKMHKKIIVCEYCGRILIDKTIEEKVRGNN